MRFAGLRNLGYGSSHFVASALTRLNSSPSLRLNTGATPGTSDATQKYYVIRVYRPGRSHWILKTVEEELVPSTLNGGGRR